MLVLEEGLLNLSPNQDAIVANEGLGCDSVTKKCNNPGGDYYWEGG